MTAANNLIAFRADAGVAIGLGHLSRCLTLAKALQQRGARILFLVSPQTAIWLDVVEQHGFECRVLDLGGVEAHPDQLGEQQAVDSNACCRALSESPSWLVVDHYALDTTWESAVRPSIGRLMVIDDLADREHCCDVLLDQNLGLPTRYTHLVPATCETLIGPEYALLRDEFIDARPTKRIGLSRRINVFMGGTDSEGATVRVLDELTEGIDWDKLDVILGTKCPHLDTVRRRVDQLPAAELHVDSKRVGRLFADADVGIGAGGVAALERCCVGLPTLCICIAGNQLDGVAGLADLGVIESVGSLCTLPFGQIAKVLRSLMERPDRLQQMSRKGMDLVDGQGAHRVARLMLSN